MTPRTLPFVALAVLAASSWATDIVLFLQCTSEGDERLVFEALWSTTRDVSAWAAALVAVSCLPSLRSRPRVWLLALGAVALAVGLAFPGAFPHTAQLRMLGWLGVLLGLVRLGRSLSVQLGVGLVLVAGAAFEVAWQLGEVGLYPWLGLVRWGALVAAASRAAAGGVRT